MMLTTFELENVTFSDGGTASGFFVLDTTNLVSTQPSSLNYVFFTAVDIVTTAGTELPGAIYDAKHAGFFGAAGTTVASIFNSDLTYFLGLSFVSLSTTDSLPLTPTPAYPGEAFLGLSQEVWRTITSGSLVPVVSVEADRANVQVNHTADPPPLKWSDLRYVFDIQEDCNGKEAIQA
jgi:hypothetical protein